MNRDRVVLRRSSGGSVAHLQRVARALVGFIIGVCFAYAAIVPAYAQSIPATLNTQPSTPGVDGFKGGGVPNVQCRTNKYQACIDADSYIGWTTLCFDGGTVCRNASGFTGDRTTQACETWRGAVVTLTNCTTEPSCPAGYTLNGTTCQQYTCPAGYTLNGTMCDPEPEPCPEVGSFRFDNILTPRTPVPNQAWPDARTTCVDGCLAMLRAVSATPNAWVWSVQYVDGVGNPTGQCTGGISVGEGPLGPDTDPATPEDDPVEPPTPEDAACIRQGKCPGVVNGQAVCMPCTSQPGGGSSTTTSGTTTNPDGTTSTTERRTTTTCDGGQCTTTTTTTTTTRDAQGNPTGTTTSTESRTGPGTGPGSGGNGDGDGDERGSSFGGACAAGFACEGDAIQCAIAREQHIKNCRFWESKGGLSEADAVKAFDDARGTDAKKLNAEPVAFQNLERTAFLGAGTLSDVSFTVQGQTLSIPFSELVPFLQAMGLAFMAVCGVIAIGIIRTGVA
ncbi:MAG: hypothetical protein [Inoviridae sp. ctBZ32]|nr:MAG: hypothetical protein [Inoviridae sp. ctBZ32]